MSLLYFSDLAYSANTCVFHPDGEEVMIAGAQRVGIVLNIKTGEAQGELVGHNKQITSSDWKRTSDGSSSLLLTASEDQTVKTWLRKDVIPGDVFEAFAEDSWRPTSAFGLAFTKQDELFGLDNELNIFQCSTSVLEDHPPMPVLIKTGAGDNMGDKTSSNLSPDGLTWAVCSYAGSSLTMRHSDGEKINTFALDVAHNCLRWDASGKTARFLATGHGVGCRVWDSVSGDIDCDLDITGWSWDACWSRDGRFIAVSNDANTAVFDITQNYEKGGTLQTCFQGMQSFRCALIGDGSRLGIVGKTGGGYGTAPTCGLLYDLSDLEHVEDPTPLTGDFTNAETMVFSSDSKFLFVNFKSLAFGTSPSICAYDSYSGIAIAWFVSPMNVNFARLAVPYQSCSKLVVSDASGKLYLLKVEEP